MIVYTVGSEESLPRYPNGKIVDDGKVVILKEYPTCSMDGSLTAQFSITIEPCMTYT